MVKEQPRRYEGAAPRTFPDAPLEERGRLTVNSRFAHALADAGLDDVDLVLGFRGGQSLAKPGLPAQRRRDRIVLPDGRTIYLKRYNPGRRQWIGRVLRLAGGWEALAEWDALRQLASAGIGVPEPVLVGRRGLQSCIALADLAGANSLEKWLPGRPIDPDWARRLGGFVGRFHRLGLVHRDLYLCHIFISTGDDRRAVFHLIDLARVFRPKIFARRWRVKDIAQLLYSSRLAGVGRPAAWRFFRAYCQAVGEANPRRLAGAVVRKSARIARHAARRQQRLGA